MDIHSEVILTLHFNTLSLFLNLRNPRSQPGILELILAKARHGNTGKAEVLFDKSSGMIRSLKEFA
ncbi:hypothetical protein [Pleurocapsa sp. PCC 7319]|uniref:hypothetical protein n=1 Tax=Pleurocapsa sp. PCC 7319 TaxID=118161 RepID=UPI00034AF6D1|nr:hypothetical protein [Pleurocapsa sp. PCC 7319]